MAADGNMKIRLEKLQTALRASGADVVALVPGPTLTYVTGLSFHLSKRPMVLFIPAAGDPTLVIPTLEVSRVADNPPFPGKAFQQWVQWLFKENRLVRGRVELRGQRVDLSRITQSTLVVTAGADHIAPRVGTLPLLDMTSSEDITHFDRAGGHIGLMAGSKARKEIWPDIADWLAERSD